VRLADEGRCQIASPARQPACSACGTMKRHYFDQLAIDRGFPVVAATTT
jgi:hypothetical protein